MLLKEHIEELLGKADITINGSRPWDIQVHNDAFYKEVLTRGSLGAGEAYVDEWWDCEQLDEFFHRILRSRMEQHIRKNPKLLLKALLHKAINFQSKSKATHTNRAHYNIGNDLFSRMLDKRMVYTCGYWKQARTLDEAQEHKLDLVCKKLGLTSGMSVLDIGCGWGSFAKFAAEKYDVKVTGITVSEEQVKLGQELCSGLPAKIELMDYRDVRGSYDRIVSLGMFEHVGYKNYHTFMKVAHRCLKEDGLFMLHTIGSNTSGTFTDPWLDKYIFPNSLIPSITQIGKALEGLFVVEDWHNFGANYDKTLMAWYNNFNSKWHEIRDKYDQCFYRMWRYYLLMCAGAFRARKNQLWQIVLSKNGMPGGYTSLR